VIIVHIDFTGTYNEEMNYQENLLPRANALHGNCVYFVTTCYRWNNGLEEKVAPERITLPDGVRLVRMPYTSFGLEALNKRFRAVSGLYTLMQQIHPDVVFLHCVQTAAVYSIIKYVKKHPNVVFYADTHTDFHNSAHGLFSRYILHRLIYRKFSKDIQPHIKKLFYITPECKDFIEKVYGFPSYKLEYLPLGGFLYDDENYSKIRENVRRKYGFQNNDIILIHSGKMDINKKSDELISCFIKHSKSNMKLVVAGVFDNNLEKIVMPLVGSVSNIIYTGWISGNELGELFCASDVYIQPGTQSASMQVAACNRCALALYPYLSHKNLWKESAFYITNYEELKTFFLTVSTSLVQSKRYESYNIAKKKLNYLELAERIEKKS